LRAGDQGIRARGEQEPGSGRFKVKQWQREQMDSPGYYFEFPECTAWGATAKILKNFLERLLGITLV